MEILTKPEFDRIRDLRERDEFFWLDLALPSDDQLRELARILGLHQLALEDTLEFGQPPKLDPYDDHVLLVFYTARVVGGGAAVEPLEIHVYVHGGFVMTVRHADCAPLQALHKRLSPDEMHEEEYLVYSILDALADGYLPVVKTVDDLVDELEEEVLEHPRNEHLRRIYRLKQDVHQVGRRVAAQRDMFPAAVEAILRVPGLEHGARAYLRDVGDRLGEVAGDLNRLNQDLTELSTTFFNANANRLSVVATRLGVVAAIFFVATFVTSFFGQNFKWMTDNIASGSDFLVFGVGILAGAVALTVGYFVWRRDEYF